MAGAVNTADAQDAAPPEAAASAAPPAEASARPRTLPVWQMAVCLILGAIGLLGLADEVVVWKDWFETGWMRLWREATADVAAAISGVIGVTTPRPLLDYALLGAVVLRACAAGFSLDSNRDAASRLGRSMEEIYRDEPDEDAQEEAARGAGDPPASDAGMEYPQLERIAGWVVLVSSSLAIWLLWPAILFERLLTATVVAIRGPDLSPGDVPRSGARSRARRALSWTAGVVVALAVFLVVASDLPERIGLV